MKENLDKIRTMINFANKAGKLIFGYNQTLVTNSKKIGIILLSNAVSENSQKKMIKHATLEKTYTFSDKEFIVGDLINNPNVKILTIIKSGFSKKILQYLSMEQIGIRHDTN